MIEVKFKTARDSYNIMLPFYLIINKLDKDESQYSYKS